MQLREGFIKLFDPVNLGKDMNGSFTCKRCGDNMKF